MKTNDRAQQGFSLIELLIVIIIISVLSSIAVIGYNRVQRGIRDKMAQTRLAVFADAQTRFSVGLGRGRYATACELTQTRSARGEVLIPETTAKFDNPTSSCTPVPIDGWYVSDGLTAADAATSPTLRRQYLIRLYREGGAGENYCISSVDTVLRKSDAGACSLSSNPVQ